MTDKNNTDMSRNLSHMSYVKVLTTVLCVFAFAMLTISSSCDPTVTNGVIGGTFSYGNDVIITQVAERLEIRPISNQITGLPHVRYSIEPPLAPHVTLDENTGIITGRPQTQLAETEYTVSAHGENPYRGTLNAMLKIKTILFKRAITGNVSYSYGHPRYLNEGLRSLRISNENQVEAEAIITYDIEPSGATYTAIIERADGSAFNNNGVNDNYPIFYDVNPHHRSDQGRISIKSGVGAFTVSGAEHTHNKKFRVRLIGTGEYTGEVVEEFYIQYPSSQSHPAPTLMAIEGDFSYGNNVIFTQVAVRHEIRPIFNIIIGTVRYSIEPPLAPGVTLDKNTGIITGRPQTQLAETEYTVSAHGENPYRGTLSTTLRIKTIETGIELPRTDIGGTFSYGNDVIITVINEMFEFGPISNQITGIPHVRYTIEPPLAPHVTLDENTGIITGTAQTQLAETEYTVSAHGENPYRGTLSTTLRIKTIEARKELSGNVSINFSAGHPSRSDGLISLGISNENQVETEAIITYFSNTSATYTAIIERADGSAFNAVNDNYPIFYDVNPHHRSDQGRISIKSGVGAFTVPGAEHTHNKKFRVRLIGTGEYTGEVVEEFYIQYPSSQSHPPPTLMAIEGAFSYGNNVIITQVAERLEIRPISNTIIGTVRYSIEPPLASHVTLDENTGIITGRPQTRLAETEYTVSARGIGYYEGRLNAMLKIKTILSKSPITGSVGYSYGHPRTLNEGLRSLRISNEIQVETEAIITYNISPSGATYTAIIERADGSAFNAVNDNYPIFYDVNPHFMPNQGRISIKSGVGAFTVPGSGRLTHGVGHPHNKKFRVRITGTGEFEGEVVKEFYIQYPSNQNHPAPS